MEMDLDGNSEEGNDGQDTRDKFYWSIWVSRESSFIVMNERSSFHISPHQSWVNERKGGMTWARHEHDNHPSRDDLYVRPTIPVSLATVYNCSGLMKSIP